MRQDTEVCCIKLLARKYMDAYVPVTCTCDDKRWVVSSQKNAGFFTILQNSGYFRKIQSAQGATFGRGV